MQDGSDDKLFPSLFALKQPIKIRSKPRPVRTLGYSVALGVRGFSPLRGVFSRV